jgi:shikimate dehydrogenase
MSNNYNIILIGMPGVGKTLLGKDLSIKLNKPFYDTDELIIKKYNMNLHDLVKMYSWEWFRNEEYIILKKLLELDNIIISTGGGIIENHKIYELIKLHTVIYITRNVSDEIKNKRLLSKSYDILFKEREPIYRKLSNYTYKNDGNIEKFYEYVKELLGLGSSFQVLK